MPLGSSIKKGEQKGFLGNLSTQLLCTCCGLADFEYLWKILFYEKLCSALATVWQILNIYEKFKFWNKNLSIYAFSITSILSGNEKLYHDLLYLHKKGKYSCEDDDL